MALRQMSSLGVNGSYPRSNLVVIPTSDLLCSFTKQICCIYGSRLPKGGKGIFMHLLFNLNFK